VFGARPTGNLHGSIEDATRWGGMFERLHASYLDPNGVWRVYTQREGQEPSSPGHSLGDSLQVSVGLSLVLVPVSVASAQCVQARIAAWAVLLTV